MLHCEDRGVEIQIHTFLTSTLDADEWLLYHQYSVTGDLGDPWSSPETVAKRKISFPAPAGNSTLIIPACSPVKFAITTDEVRP
jgi:hypothetical protein